VLSFLKKKLGEEVKGSTLCQVTVTKFLKQLHKYSEDEKLNPALEIEAVVEGAEFLMCLQDDTLLEKFVKEVLQQNPNANLLKKLLAGDLGKSVISEPIKCLILARIDQLWPIAEAGKPVFTWHQPEALLPGHPQVQAFLRGPNKSFVYSKFNAKCHAKDFEREYFMGRGNESYSAKVEVIGSRRNTLVEITKLADGHDITVERFVEDCEELIRLQSKIDAN
jgi:hypothetical protein